MVSNNVQVLIAHLYIQKHNKKRDTGRDASENEGVEKDTRRKKKKKKTMTAH